MTCKIKYRLLEFTYITWSNIVNFVQNEENEEQTKHINKLSYINLPFPVGMIKFHVFQNICLHYQIGVSYRTSIYLQNLCRHSIPSFMSRVNIVDMIVRDFWYMAQPNLENEAGIISIYVKHSFLLGTIAYQYCKLMRKIHSWLVSEHSSRIGKFLIAEENTKQKKVAAISKESRNSLHLMKLQ